MNEKIEIKIVSRADDDYGTYDYWCIYVDGEAVGSASVQNYDTKEDDGIYISRIDVFDGYRNHGYGTMLLKAIDKHYNDEVEYGTCRKFLCPDNEDSARLYERLGEKASNYPDIYDYCDNGYGVYEITNCSYFN